MKSPETPNLQSRVSDMYRRRSQRALIPVVILLVAGISCLGIVNPLRSIGATRQGQHRVVFGISDTQLVNESPAAQAIQLKAMKAFGIASVRVDADWRQVQPTGPRKFRWKTLDQEINSIRKVGLSVDLIIDNCPAWAAVPSAAHRQFPQPASPTLYATWAAKVAARYSKYGVRYFEIWNEPNIIRFWHPKPNAAAYTADLKAAYAAIKKVDPNAFIISGGLAPAGNTGINYNPRTYLAAMYKYGVKGSFDALGDHPYSFPFTPNKNPSWTAWAEMARTTPSIRGIMSKYGDSGKPIWITEYGAPSSGPRGIGERAQRAELMQAIADSKRISWIGAFYIYTWRDFRRAAPRDNGFGILTKNSIPKVAFLPIDGALVAYKLTHPQIDSLRPQAS